MINVTIFPDSDWAQTQQKLIEEGIEGLCDCKFDIVPQIGDEIGVDACNYTKKQINYFKNVFNITDFAVFIVTKRRCYLKDIKGHTGIDICIKPVY